MPSSRVRADVEFSRRKYVGVQLSLTFNHAEPVQRPFVETHHELKLRENLGHRDAVERLLEWFR